MSLKARIQDDMKAAMRARDKERLATIRMILAGIKQREVDERIELDDTQINALLDKMIKQRRESASQYRDAGRDELAAAEDAEIAVIQTYLPEPLDAAELQRLVDAAIADTGAAGMQDMGKVMGRLKPQVQGRADMGQVSAQVKARLAG